MQPTPGIHHITAIAGSARDNLRFYRDLLGLRFLKKTVNFDDPTTYHLYYGDKAGSPGTILTFFPWERMRRGRPGAGQIVAIGFHVPVDSLAYWRGLLEGEGLAPREEQRMGERLLRFGDPDGLTLELIETPEAAALPFWGQGPIPDEKAIRGFHSATALYRHAADSVPLLTDVLGMRVAAEEEGRTRYAMSGANVPGIHYDVVEDPAAERGVQGTGTVHHIAFRVGHHEEQEDLRRRVAAAFLQVTPIIDRTYFHSIYFREPGGVLFEAATDAPGFTVDESVEDLGSSLKLPPQHEPHRAGIERSLPPLADGEIQHVYLPAERNDVGVVLALHGTGGNEHDLLSLAREVAPAHAVLSPRGQANEHGMNRFFRRLRLNVFDEEDLIRRTGELADFVEQRLAVEPARQRGIVALGYSNGANMAASLLFLRPGLLRSAVLLRPMLPLVPESPPDLDGVHVLILAGRHDGMIPGDSTRQLVEALKRYGADVTATTLDAGHEITEEDVRAAAAFIAHGAGSGISY